MAKLSKTTVLCPLVFKSRSCGYSGEAESCDKTFRCCIALGNEVNFAGVYVWDRALTMQDKTLKK